MASEKAAVLRLRRRPHLEHAAIKNAATPQSEPKHNKRCLIFTYELMMLLWLTVQQAGVGLKGPVFVEKLIEPVPVICNLSHFASL